MTAKQLVIYQTADGHEPFNRWRKRLGDKVTIARVDRRLDRVRAGNYGDYKPVGNGVFELRLFFGPGYRIYFAEDGDTLVLLLSGGDKSSQAKDIQAAQSYWQDYRTNKRQEDEE